MLLVGCATHEPPRKASFHPAIGPLEVLVLPNAQYSVEGRPISCSELSDYASNYRPSVIVANMLRSIGDAVCLAGIAQSLGISAGSIGSDGQFHEIRVTN